MRQTLNGRVIGPDERVDIHEALRLHTMGSAYAAHEENVRGSIEAGKSADVVVWSDDMYSIPADKIRELEAELTIVEGRIVHKSSDTQIEEIPSSQYAGK
jgi:predicted amidohydrolase YtcJ